MDFEKLIVADARGNTLATPTLSVFMFYNQPMSVIGSAVAEVAESYINEFAKEHLIVKFKQTGRPGDFTDRALKTDMNRLRDTKGIPEHRIIYDSGEDAWAGSWGVHFNGEEVVPSRDEPSLTNFLRLDFPANFFAEDPDMGVQSFSNLLGLSQASYGYVTLCMKRLESTTSPARRGVHAVINRFGGFDPCYLPMRYSMRYKTFGAHWIDFFSPEMLSAWGLSENDLNASGTQLYSDASGFACRNARLPPVVDANRQMTDYGVLPSMARLLKPMRTKLARFGDPQFDAQAWIGRFDECEDTAWDNTASTINWG